MDPSIVKIWLESLEPPKKPEEPEEPPPREDLLDRVQSELEELASDVIQTLIMGGRTRISPGILVHDNFGTWWQEFSRVLKFFNHVAPGRELDFLSLIAPLGVSPTAPSRQQEVVAVLRDKLLKKVSLDRLLLRDLLWTWARPVTLSSELLSTITPTLVSGVRISSVSFPAIRGPCVIELYRPLEVLGDYQSLVPRAAIPRAIRDRSDQGLRENCKALLIDALKTTAREWSEIWVHKLLQWPEKQPDSKVIELTEIKIANGKVIFQIKNGYIKFDREARVGVGSEKTV